MNKHIWYRLEYKRIAWRLDKAALWMVGAALFFAIAGGTTMPINKTISDFLAVPAIICFLIYIVCMALSIAMTEVDKHEWELTKKIKGGQTR